MKRIFAALVAAVLIAGCGGHHAPKVSKFGNSPTAQPAGFCPPGQSFMGCATPHTLGIGPKLTVPAGHLFPDVSSYQGHPNWAAAKPHIAGAIAKAFEYHEDPDFAYNVAALKAQRLPWGAYDFVRFCDASGFIAVLRSVGGPTSLPPVIDMEVPAARGCAPALDRQVFAAFHRHAVIYTAPGTWPGGSNAGLPVWEATYGSGFSAVWHPVLAWQFTDGKWGSTVYIPGIGQGDVSVDYGLLEQVPNPLPVCFSHRMTASQCAAAKAKVAAAQRGAQQSLNAYLARGCDVLKARERWFANAIAHDHSAHGRARLTYRKGALAATRRAESRQSCGVFTGRVDYFLALENQIKGAN